MAQVKFWRRRITDSARRILCPHGRHGGGQYNHGIDFPEKLLNALFTIEIGPFTEMRPAKIAFPIQQILCWPCTIGEGLPEFVVAINHDGISQSKLADAALDVRFILRKGEFRRVYADYRQAFVPISLMPGLDIRQSTNAVEAGVIPEINQYNAATELPQAQRRGVKPDAANLGRAYGAFVHLHVRTFSRCRPTRDAQYSTNSRSSPENAAGKWLSISSSPTTLPPLKMGTTISDFVSIEHAR